MDDREASNKWVADNVVSCSGKFGHELAAFKARQTRGDHEAAEIARLLDDWCKVPTRIAKHINQALLNNKEEEQYAD